MGEAIVEPLLVDAIERINRLPREEAEHVASLVRRITSDQGFVRVVRDGLNVKLAPTKTRATSGSSISTTSPTTLSSLRRNSRFAQEEPVSRDSTWSA